MPAHPFDLAFDTLPEKLAVFPLPGALLLPRGILPLNIFRAQIPEHDPRCIIERSDGRHDSAPRRRLRRGVVRHRMCGRITAFQETDDGRLLINLTGLCRFAIAEELELLRGYRRVRPDWQAFRTDLEPTQESGVDSASLTDTARRYFNATKIECDWERLAKLSTLELTNFLAMHLPLAPADKQVILEAISLEERAKSLTLVMQMNSIEEQPTTRH